MALGSRGRQTERKKGKRRGKIRVWSTPVMPETLTKRGKAESPCCGGPRFTAGLLINQPMDQLNTQWRLPTLRFGVIYVKLDLVYGHCFSPAAHGL